MVDVLRYTVLPDWVCTDNKGCIGDTVLEVGQPCWLVWVCSMDTDNTRGMGKENQVWRGVGEMG